MRFGSKECFTANRPYIDNTGAGELRNREFPRPVGRAGRAVGPDSKDGPALERIIYLVRGFRK